jgi:quinol monooxygenase YgiN
VQSVSVDRCRVVELRRYALRPGQRETLIELFDRELVETQEAVGMCVLGQFRDLDDPDSFVWMRGFNDMETRKDALEAFYGGPVWREHARAANATMIDSDNVLLLRPVAGLELDLARRAAAGSTVDPPGLLAVTIWPFGRGTAARVPELFRDALAPALGAAGISVLATYATEHSENTFPALPVRENEDVFVCMSMFDNEAAHARASTRSNTPRLGVTLARRSPLSSPARRRSSGLLRRHARQCMRERRGVMRPRRQLRLQARAPVAVFSRRRCPGSDVRCSN